MSSTRSVISPPPFAADALTVIPPTPIAGVSYRDPIAGPASSPAGWPYAERVNSAEFNQILFQLSTLLSIIDKKGILGWSSGVVYSEAASVYGSDGKLYSWIAESGPGTGSGVQDPVSSPTFWAPSPVKLATQAQVNALTEQLAAVTPQTLGNGATMSFLATGHLRLPTWLGSLIIQWGPVPSIPAGGSYTATYSIAFPNGPLALLPGSGAGSAGLPGINVLNVTNSQGRFYNQSNSVASSVGTYLVVGT